MVPSDSLRKFLQEVNLYNLFNIFSSTAWVSRKDMKEAYPILTAEYAVQVRLAKEAAFAWWVSNTLRKRNRVIAKVKSKYWIRTHKFGIKIPKTVEETQDLMPETVTPSGGTLS